ncbi:MAG TPA: polyphenol oxidase family protein [Candidatus Bathyarchaeia archaeon]|nr:polyphenol oxidase family protein [Candidatus Bathyarchaeia archaeon]
MGTPHQFGPITMYFGDASENISPTLYENSKDGIAHPLSHPSFACISHIVPSQYTLFFPHQVHGTNGIILRDTSLPSFFHDADFVLTKNNATAIGIVSADCVPCIMYDPRADVIGIAHAGWRGAVFGVVDAMLDATIATFGTCISDIFLWFGPCAHSCCYQVDAAFAHNLADTGKEYALMYKNGQYFFSLIDCITHQCIKRGIRTDHISSKFSVCTIHTMKYCSYRRQGKASNRQITIVL